MSMRVPGGGAAPQTRGRTPNDRSARRRSWRETVPRRGANGLWCFAGAVARQVARPRRLAWARGLAAVLACAALGCGGATSPPGEPAPSQAPPGEPAPGEPAPSESRPSTAELEALYHARIDSARMRFTQADVRFMRDMLAHHAQALVMADLAEDRAVSPSIRTLAARIDNAQRDEIATIERWLADRDQPVPKLHVEGTLVLVDGVDHAGHMPGMLTADEMAALERSRGPDFDRLFLESMIRHHRGAVAMVDALFGTDGAAQDEEVFRFAADVRADQATEIERMERMLDALTGGAGRS